MMESLFGCICIHCKVVNRCKTVLILLLHSEYVKLACPDLFAAYDSHRNQCFMKLSNQDSGRSLWNA